MRQTIFTSILGIVLALSLVTDWYLPLSIVLAVTLLAMIVYKIGKGIVLLEVTAFLYTFTCVVMPHIGYAFYTSSNFLSKLWGRYMPVSEQMYFSYALPAIAGFCLALTWPAFKQKFPDEGVKINDTIARIKLQLINQKNTGLQIVLTGTIISLVAKLLPVGLNYFATLFFFGSFAGFLYIYFSPAFKYKKLILILFIVFILWNALQTGMFTMVAYMGITLFSFFQLGRHSSILRKFALVMLGIGFLIVLQNVKANYRVISWKKSYEGNKVELFAGLFADNLQKWDALLDKNALFPQYIRANQGYNVALVMKRIPAVRTYDNGERLLTEFASAFVPRFLWPDKPEAGGKFNMYYYAGWRIEGWSTNIGPLGEAYGSFGAPGGIVYMFFLGLFIRLVYVTLFKMARKTPLLICWLSVLFFEIISSAETDSLQIFNSIFKAAFFVWLLYKFLPHWFGVIRPSSIKKLKKEVSIQPS